LGARPPRAHFSAPPGTITRGNLEARRNSLQSKHTEIQGRINDQELASGDLRARKLDMIARLNQFKETVHAKLPGSPFLGALPLVPSEPDAHGNFVPALDDMETLRGKINTLPGNPGFMPPLTLLGGHALADFTTALAGLRSQFGLVGRADLLVTLARGERTKLEQTIYPILRSYRVAVPSEFPEGDPLAQSLPKLSPKPGSTPDAVNAMGIWNAPTSNAKITWTASTDPDLAQYEIRWSPGSTYNVEDESGIGNADLGAPLEFFTLQGLGLPGAVSVFKVYVMTNTGNERGSNTVKITKP
jgi:hypothetical protein